MKKYLYLFFILIFFTTNISTVKADSYSNIKSVTWYLFGYPDTHTAYQKLSQQLPIIKASGFNTIWLVNPWQTFEDNQSAFDSLKQILALLRQHSMSAIIGLNYLGQGWAPPGIDACSWVEHSDQYQRFITYSNAFLTQISDYNDIVYILIFTENSEPCRFNVYNPDEAKQIAQILRNTLGNFPNQINPALRSKFKIGYHDYITNLDLANGETPINSPTPYDFLSMIGYDSPISPIFENATKDQIKNELSIRKNRFKSKFPDIPLIMGESGSNGCGSKETNQTKINSSIVEWAVQQQTGFNLWGWIPGPEDLECTNPVFGGLAITNQDGSAKPTLLAIKNLLTLNGDIDSNKSVDIFDYNILVSEFGKNGDYVSDIDVNKKVDIFDYNQLVANFGKTL